jgi:hypothetical protein
MKGLDVEGGDLFKYDCFLRNNRNGLALELVQSNYNDIVLVIHQ